MPQYYDVPSKVGSNKGFDSVINNEENPPLSQFTALFIQRRRFAKYFPNK
jgi:hypothetical protein